MIPLTELPLPVGKARYLRERYHDVEGFCSPSTGLYLAGLELLQRDMGLTGDICEIGVHHGRSFFCLAVDLPGTDQAVAIDCFDDQSLNVDRSGKGDRDVFEKHAFEFGVTQLDILECSSLDLRVNGFIDVGKVYRFFSIDGGHTEEITANDLWVAEKTLIDGGLVALDDIVNRHWLGVMSGLFRYWSEGGSLVPTLMTPDKLLLTTSEQDSRRYRDAMRANFTRGTTKFNVPIGAGEVDVYGEYPWTVADTEGESGLLMDVQVSNAVAAHTTRIVPEEYLADLEAQSVRLKQTAQQLTELLHKSSEHEKQFTATLAQRDKQLQRAEKTIATLRATPYWRARRWAGKAVRLVPGGGSLLALRRGRGR